MAVHTSSSSAQATGPAGDSSSTAGGQLAGSSSASDLKITLDELLRIGTAVKAVTTHGTVYEGHVIALDQNSKQMILTVPLTSNNQSSSQMSSGQPGAAGNLTNCSSINPSSNQDIVLLNMACLAQLDYINSCSASQTTLNNKTTPAAASSSDSCVTTTTAAAAAGGGGGEAKLPNVVLPTLGPVNINEIDRRRAKHLDLKWKRIEDIGIGVTPVAQNLYDKLKNQYVCSWQGTSIRIDSLKLVIKAPYEGAESIEGDERSRTHVRTLIDQIFRSNASTNNPATSIAANQTCVNK